ncbi:hypothetical protein [Roseixanthobacter glucoisosaccharinicivorans]|uniref:hypothetical protein n=1 Tax=Roseixanthobacter glucoisosaccharinicivorans TaxID=3119923 RepID=UPI00372A7C00
MKDEQSLADYVASLTGELQRLALAKRLEVLAFLLEMARLEAEKIVQDALK